MAKSGHFKRKRKKHKRNEVMRELTKRLEANRETLRMVAELKRINEESNKPRGRIIYKPSVSGRFINAFTLYDF